MPSNDSYRNESASFSPNYRSSSGGENHNHQHHRRGTNRRDRRPKHITGLPFEQGIICSLKESFGFIHCAERPEEIFFHYSEVTNCHPDELKIDTEVEFKVGTSGGGGGGGEDNSSKKFAAFQVKTVETGTVVWETEDDEGQNFKGYVERPTTSRSSRDGGRVDGNGGRGFESDGAIRISINDSRGNNSQNENNDNITDDIVSNGENEVKAGPVVRLRPGEYIGALAEPNASTTNIPLSSSEHHKNRLFRGDFVEFRVFTDRRTKQKYGRQIKLIQSERDRKRIEKEKRLLKNATAEEGIIVSLNNGFGFIKSNKRREHVYFHFTHISIPEKRIGNISAASEDDIIGNVGDEKKAPENTSNKFQLKKGQEVKFLVVIDSSSDKHTSNNNKQQSLNLSSSKVSARQVGLLPAGSVVFHTVEATGVKGIVVTVPRAPSSGSKSGDDSKEGKILLLQKLQASDSEISNIDESSHVQEVAFHYSNAPGGVYTYQNHRRQPVSGLWIHEGDTLLFDVIKETVDGCYRAVPTFHTIELGGSIIKPNHNDAVNDEAKPVVRLISPSMVGRAEGIIYTLKADYGFIHFAERPIDVHFKFHDIMPLDLQCDIRKNMGIGDPVKIEDGVAVQFDICSHGSVAPASGMNRSRRGQTRENVRGQRVILLPKSVVTIDKLIAKNVMGVIKSVDHRQLYAGVAEMKDSVEGFALQERHPLIAQMIDSFLHESALPYGRKSLIFRDTLEMKDNDVIVEMVNMMGNNVLACSHIPVPGISPHPGRLCIRRVGNRNDKDDDESKEQEPNGRRKIKVYDNVPYDKSGLDETLKEDLPPSQGDTIKCDVFQSRRSGNVLMKNMKIVERKVVDATGSTVIKNSCLGVVKDVVAKRNFGFISVFDDNSTKSELLFFHLPKESKKLEFVKGAEVKFNIAIKSSKRIAINVESVPKGTIPSIASKNACLGYILMEPSHTSLSDTPVRKVKNGNDKVGNGRWTKTDSVSIKTPTQDMLGDGCILLLEDKKGIFQKKRKAKRRKEKPVASNSTDSSDDFSGDETMSIASEDGLSSDDDLSVDTVSSDDGQCPEDNNGSSILSHIIYKNGSIAIRGPGSNFSNDSSANLRRGDLVSFLKGRKRKSAREIKVIKRQAATLQRGRLENIELIDTEDKKNKGNAKFIAETDEEEVYDINLAEVVSCTASILKEKEVLEGIVHEGRVYGLCRINDLYLASKTGHGKSKQRQKLNLTVKKDRGGTIMAQSMMAKGPDGTNGFKAGWTKRISRYELEDKNDDITDEES